MKIRGGRHHKETKLQRRQAEYDRAGHAQRPDRKRPGSNNRKK